MGWISEYQNTHVLCRRLPYWESVYFHKCNYYESLASGIFQNGTYIYMNITTTASTTVRINTGRFVRESRQHNTRYNPILKSKIIVFKSAEIKSRSPSHAVTDWVYCPEAPGSPWPAC